METNVPPHIFFGLSNIRTEAISYYHQKLGKLRFFCGPINFLDFSYNKKWP